MNLKQLRKFAKELGLTIEAVRDDVGWGYWIDGTEWESETFCTSHEEVEWKLKLFEKVETNSEG
jgi:hypothetical protein